MALARPDCSCVPLTIELLKRIGSRDKDAGRTKLLAPWRVGSCCLSEILGRGVAGLSTMSRVREYLLCPLGAWREMRSFGAQYHGVLAHPELRRALDLERDGLVYISHPAYCRPRQGASCLRVVPAISGSGFYSHGRLYIHRSWALRSFFIFQPGSLEVYLLGNTLRSFGLCDAKANQVTQVRRSFAPPSSPPHAHPQTLMIVNSSS